MSVQTAKRNPLFTRDGTKCIVPGCFGTFESLDKNGMCPTDLWDDAHLQWLANLNSYVAGAK